MLQFLEIVSQDENCMTIWMHCWEREERLLLTYTTGKIPPKLWQKTKQAARRASAGACLTVISRPYTALNELRLGRLKMRWANNNECNLMTISAAATISVPVRRPFFSRLIDTMYAGTFLGREPYRILSKFYEQLTKSYYGILENRRKY